MSVADIDPNASAPADEQRDAVIRRRNRRLLIALAIIALIGMLSSYHLFNNYWDPTQSDQVISH